MRRHFGTDGIRGRVGEGPMQADFVLKLGWAVGSVLCPRGGTVLVGKDTRLSGYLFEAALEAGFSSAGVDVLMVGPLPTPGIAHLVQAFEADAGVVISASHNPYHDNGLKFFTASGTKLPDDVEAAIESQLERPFTTVASDKLGRARRVEDAVERYMDHCLGSINPVLSLAGLKLVLDCANGATYKVAPMVFERLGADLETLSVEPDGLNINHESGSTHPERLVDTVVRSGADLGIAFDGDGDRVVMVAPDGSILDGDDLLYIIARDRQRTPGLRGPVVGTVMSNLGLERAFDAAGIPFMRSKVGDRHVLQMLEQQGGIIGGEQSGHILCLDRATTGDGIIAALQVLAASVRTGVPVIELATDVVKVPQVLKSVRVARLPDLDEEPAFQDILSEAEHELGDGGRILLRASGTEPVIRVMVEGDEPAMVERICAVLVDAVRRAAGGDMS